MLENDAVKVAFGFDVFIAKLIATGNYKILDEGILATLHTGDVFNGGGFIPANLRTRDPEKANAIRKALSKALRTIQDSPERMSEVVAAKFKVTHDIAETTAFDKFRWPDESLMAGKSQRKGMEHARRRRQTFCRYHRRCHLLLWQKESQTKNLRAC